MSFFSPLLPRPSRLPALLVLALSLVVIGCGDDEPVGGGNMGGTFDAEFVIQPGAFDAGTMAFVPARDTVQVGQVVRVRNGDSLVHQIDTLTPGGPSWGTISAGGVRDRTATAAGTFTFECKVGGHTMSGILVVLP
jgi:plastocyanin